MEITINDLKIGGTVYILSFAKGQVRYYTSKAEVKVVGNEKVRVARGEYSIFPYADFKNCGREYLVEETESVLKDRLFKTSEEAEEYGEKHIEYLTDEEVKEKWSLAQWISNIQMHDVDEFSYEDLKAAKRLLVGRR